MLTKFSLITIRAFTVLHTWTYFEPRKKRTKLLVGICTLRWHYITMVNFLIDNIYVEFRGIIFQQIIGNPMGINVAPLLADMFLYPYESEFIQKLQRSGAKKNQYLWDRTSSDYSDFVKRGFVLAARLAKQGFSLSRLQHSFKMFYGRHPDLIGKYDKSMSTITKAILGMAMFK